MATLEHRLLDQENKAQDIESWITDNNLDESILTALKESDVNSIQDLYFLKVQDIEDFTKELGLKIIQRRKFETALISLLQNNNPQQPSTAFVQPQQQSIINNYDQQSVSKAQPQHQRKHKQKLLYDGSVKSATDPMPNGHKFTLQAEDRSMARECGDGRFYILIGVIPFAIFALAVYLLYEWIDTGDDAYLTFVGVCSIIDVIACIVSALCYGLCPCQYNAEKWLKYILILDEESSRTYIICASNKGRWRITLQGSSNRIRSIGYHLRTRSVFDSAWVVLTLDNGEKRNMNREPCDGPTVTVFVKRVNAYFIERERKIRKNNKQFIQDMVANGAVIIET